MNEHENEIHPEAEEEAGVWQKADEVWHKADDALRANPIPAILAAVVIGFGLGLLVRSLEPERRTADDYMDDGSEYLRSILKPWAKKGKRAYAGAADAVRDAVESAVEKARDLEHTADPVAKWWRRLWS